MRRLIIIISACIALAACSSNNSESQTQDVSTKANVTDIASKLGCSYQGEDEPQLMASESGTCGDYGVATFSNPDAQNNWYEISRQAGGYYLVGGLWTVWSDTEDQINEAKNKLGGEVQK